MNFRLAAVTIVFAILIFQSCVNHELENPELAGCSTLVSFQDDVKPIINRSCAKSGCHNGSLGDDKNWTIFERFQAKSGEVKRRINLAFGVSGHMPADGTIDPAEITAITCWVDQGSQNN